MSEVAKWENSEIGRDWLKKSSYPSTSANIHVPMKSNGYILKRLLKSSVHMHSGQFKLQVFMTAGQFHLWKSPWESGAAEYWVTFNALLKSDCEAPQKTTACATSSHSQTREPLKLSAQMMPYSSASRAFVSVLYVCEAKPLSCLLSLRFLYSLHKHGYQETQTCCYGCVWVYSSKGNYAEKIFSPEKQNKNQNKCKRQRAGTEVDMCESVKTDWLRNRYLIRDFLLLFVFFCL